MNRHSNIIFLLGISFLLLTNVTGQVQLHIHSALSSHPITHTAKTIASKGRIYIVCLGSDSYQLEASLEPRLNMAATREQLYEFAAAQSWQLEKHMDGRIHTTTITLNDGSLIVAAFPPGNNARVYLKAPISHPMLKNRYPSKLANYNELLSLGTPITESREIYQPEGYSATIIMESSNPGRRELTWVRKLLIQHGWQDIIAGNTAPDGIAAKHGAVVMKKDQLTLWLTRIQHQGRNLISAILQTNHPAPRIELVQ